MAPVNGVLTYFAEGTDHVIYTRPDSSGSSALAAACNGHPAAASNGADAFVASQGRDGQLYYSKNTAGAGWLPFRLAGGQLIDGAGIAVTRR